MGIVSSKALQRFKWCRHVTRTQALGGGRPEGYSQEAATRVPLDGMTWRLLARGSNARPDKTPNCTIVSCWWSSRYALIKPRVVPVTARMPLRLGCCWRVKEVIYVFWGRPGERDRLHFTKQLDFFSFFAFTLFASKKPRANMADPFAIFFR